MTIQLKIGGMTCGGCASAVRRVLESAPSVTAVSVDLAAGSATVQTSAAVDPALLASAIEEAGYDCAVEA